MWRDERRCEKDFALQTVVSCVQLLYSYTTFVHPLGEMLLNLGTPNTKGTSLKFKYFNSKRLSSCFSQDVVEVEASAAPTAEVR